MEFGPPAERPTYMGLARTALAPVLMFAPVLGGVIAQWASYEALFWVALPWPLVSLWLLRGLAEPRRVAVAVEQG